MAAAASAAVPSTGTRTAKARGRPLPLLSPSKENRDVYELGAEALSVLEGIRLPVAPIAIVGRARTGKSYLLNSVLRQLTRGADHGFGVGATIESCTRGIWLWSQPVRAKTTDGTDVAVLILDTEGFGASDSDQEHDARIFSLATLLCSLLVYNSVGTIDEDAIANLSFVTQLTRHIQARAAAPSADGGASEGSAHASDLHVFLPSFLWVVRDFQLELLGDDGLPMSARQYLDLSLEENPDDLRAEAMARNRTRRAITTFFRRRDCQTLVRPVENESDLQSLESLPDERLRPEFLEQRHGLLEKLLGDLLTPKSLNGSVVTGRMLAGLARSYTAAINAKAVPTIGVAWDAVVRSECREGVTRARAELADAEATVAKALPLGDAQFDEAISSARSRTLARFRESAVGPDSIIKPFEAELVADLDRVIAGLTSRNVAASEALAKDVIVTVRNDIVGPRFRAVRAGSDDSSASVDGGEDDNGADEHGADEPVITEEMMMAIQGVFASRLRGPSRIVLAAQSDFFRKLAQEASAVQASVSALKRQRLQLRQRERSARNESELSSLRSEVTGLRDRLGKSEALRDENRVQLLTLQGQLDSRVETLRVAREAAKKATEESIEAKTELSSLKGMITSERTARSRAEEELRTLRAALDEANAAISAAEAAADAARAAIPEAVAAAAAAAVASMGAAAASAVSGDPRLEGVTDEELAQRRLAAEEEVADMRSLVATESGPPSRKLGKDPVPALRPRDGPTVGAPPDADKITADAKAKPPSKPCCVVM